MNHQEEDGLLNDVLSGRTRPAPAVGHDLYEEDDVIVAELDVVLSQELADQLYVMQYPLRPMWRGYDNSMMESVRFKSGLQILEMEYRVKEEEQKREQQTSISSATTGVEYEDPTKSMQSYTVRSTVVPNKSNYMVGLFRGDELHVTPLKGVMQMRPSFTYIDQSAEAKRKKKEANGEGLGGDRSAANIRASMDDMAATKKDSDGAGGADGGVGELKPIQFLVKKRETERATQNRLRSWAHLKQLESEESFLPLDFVHRDRADALATFEKIAGRTRLAIPVPEMSTQQFMMAINPPLAEDGSPLTAEQIAADQKEPRTNYAKAELSDIKARKVAPNQVPPVISHHTAKQLPPSEQIATLFNNANVLTWAQLLEYSTITDEKQLLEYVTQHAVIIQGVFVVKTEKSYKHRAANVRNWILSRFALADPLDPESWFITRALVASQCNVSVDLAASLLDPLTSLVPGSGLQLKYAPDNDFSYAHPEICTKYLSFWKKSQAGVEQDMKRWIREAGAPVVDAAQSSAAGRAAATAKNAPRDLFKPGVSQVAAAKSLMAPGYAPHASLRSSQGASSSSDDAVAPETSNLTADIDAMALGGMVTLTESQEKAVGEFVAYALDQYGVISPKGLVKLFNMDPKKMPQFKPKEFTEDVAAQELPSHASKLRDVFISNSVANDPFRDVVIELFRASATIKRQDALAEFKKRTGKEPSRPVLTKVVTELLVVEGGLWNLKSGMAIADELKLI
jgi:DNA-directed RNA polymerase-3 subunit RPC5